MYRVEPMMVGEPDMLQCRQDIRSASTLAGANDQRLEALHRQGQGRLSPLMATNRTNRNPDTNRPRTGGAMSCARPLR
jgi:hypothetical protein